jgi:hypothetical protein
MVVDDGDELVKGLSSALTDGEEQLRDSGRVRHVLGHPGGLRIGHGWGAAQGEPDETRLEPPAAQEVI